MSLNARWCHCGITLVLACNLYDEFTSIVPCGTQCSTRCAFVYVSLERTANGMVDVSTVLQGNARDA